MSHDLHKDESQCVNKTFLEHVIKTDHLYCSLNYNQCIISLQLSLHVIIVMLRRGTLNYSLIIGERWYT